MKFLSRALLSMLLFWSIAQFGYANLSISPLKHELAIDSGAEKSATILVTNGTDSQVTLYTSKEDFVAGDDTGTPTFIKPKDQVSETYSLANWIKLENENITLAKGESREVRFTVKVPKNSEPGGHYGAIFFSPGVPKDGQVAIVQRLGVLVLINVPGNVEIRGELSGFQIGKKNGENAFSEAGQFDTFPIAFETKFKNGGNTHLKATGKIELVDENGEILKNVGKESIVSPAGAFVGEKLTDYIPVNDGFGNTLPKSERRFESIWEGFGYKVIAEDGKSEVKFKNLTEYYASKAAEKRAFLQFWESINTRTVNKKITANMTLGYEGKDREKKEFKDKKEFTISYEEQFVGMNYTVIGIAAVAILALLLYIFVIVPRSKAKLKSELLREMNGNQK
jgi:hypothetical protein